jgi:hypothetical protein
MGRVHGYVCWGMNFLESQETIKIPNVTIWIIQCSAVQASTKLSLLQQPFFFTLNNFHGGIKYLNLNKNKFCDINYFKDGKTVNMLNTTNKECFNYSFWFKVHISF